MVKSETSAIAGAFTTDTLNSLAHWSKMRYQKSKLLIDLDDTMFRETFFSPCLSTRDAFRLARCSKRSFMIACQGISDLILTDKFIRRNYLSSLTEKFRGIKTLILRSCGLQQISHLKSDSLLLPLLCLKKLTVLEITETFLTDGDLDCMNCMTSLLVLKIKLCIHIPKNPIARLPSLSNLKELVLNTTDHDREVWDEECRNIGNYFPSLERLELSRFNCAESSSIVAIGKLTQIPKLSLTDCPVNDSLLIALKQKPSLVELDVSFTQITDAGLRRLQDNSALRKLSIGDCEHVTDSGMKALSSGLLCSSLHVLDISGCTQITDAGLLSISKLTELQELTMERVPKITAIKGLPVLSSLCKLRSLRIAYCEGLILDHEMHRCYLFDARLHIESIFTQSVHVDI